MYLLFARGFSKVKISLPLFGVLVSVGVAGSSYALEVTKDAPFRQAECWQYPLAPGGYELFDIENNLYCHTSGPDETCMNDPRAVAIQWRTGSMDFPNGSFGFTEILMARTGEVFKIFATTVKLDNSSGDVLEVHHTEEASRGFIDNPQRPVNEGADFDPTRGTGDFKLGDRVCRFK